MPNHVLVLESKTLLTCNVNGHLSMTTRVSRYQKGKTNLDITEARDSEWQWHQLGHMQVCTSLQTDNHTSTPPLSFLQAGCPSCRPNQQRQSTEGKTKPTHTFMMECGGHESIGWMYCTEFFSRKPVNRLMTSATETCSSSLRQMDLFT